MHLTLKELRMMYEKSQRMLERRLMNIYHFTIVVRDATFDDNLEDVLFQAGCDDALLCQTDDVVYLEFDREAENAQSAMESAFINLNRAGFYDLILQEKGVSSLAEMAKRLGMSRATLSNYARAKRGDGHFPKPVYGVLSGSALYEWSEVAEWLYRHEKLSQTDYEVAMSANRV